MAGISAIQRLLDNQLTSKFAKSLKHSDLPEGWADNPEIVALAEDAYREAGTKSPFFKAWFGNSKVVDASGQPLEVYHGTNAYGLKKFKPGNSGYLGGGIYTTPERAIAERYTDYDTVHSLFERMENPFVVSGADSAPVILKKLYGNGAEKALAKREAKQSNASKILTKADAKKLQQKGYDGIFWDAPSGKEYSTLDPSALKSTSNRGTFNPADPNIYKGLIPAVGAGGLLALMGAEAAEAAVRPDIEDVIGKAIDGQAWAGRKAGSLESSVAKDALDGSAKYNGGDGYFTEHGLTWRNEANGWTPAQIAEGYRGIYDSPDTVVVPNVLGVNPSAKEALWNPNGKDSRSWYMPIAPYKKGFKGVTLYDPEASQVERLLKDRGYWEGGSTSSIFTPTLGERSKSIGSGTLSAVNSPSFENTIRGLEDWSKRNLPKVTGAATGAAIPLLTPEEAEADAPLSSDFWPSMARQFGLGTRGVIEGLGTGATLGFGDPGRWVADAIGLPSPETDIERQRVGLNAGVTDALTTFAGGVGAAKMAANPVVRGVGMELADKPLLGAGIGGLLGLLGYDYEEE
jgi:hypothetical protein